VKTTKYQKQIYRHHFRKNLKSMYKMASFWVVTVASLAAMYWLQLSKEEQNALLENYPILAKSAPLITMAAWIYFRARPQKSLTPELKQEELDESEEPPRV